MPKNKSVADKLNSKKKLPVKKAPKAVKKTAPAEGGIKDK